MGTGSRAMRAAVLSVLIVVFAITAARAERRVALVIGNSQYVNATVLKNPANDASDMAAALTRLGFEVVRGTDLDNAEMRETVRRFANRLEGADVALFFYAGHAVQVAGRNYLAPVDTALQKESDLDFETIPLDLVQRQMERAARTNLIFLDACRDNPLTRRLVRASRSTGGSRGLAQLETSGEGTFIAFATQPDNVALDGSGRNSPFTDALLKHIDRPGIEISTLMTDVRREVYDATGERQLPWTNSSLLGHFYFNPEAPQSAATGSGDAERRRLERIAAEAAAWAAIKDASDPQAIERFLTEFPDGAYAALASSTLERVRAASVAAAPDGAGAGTPDGADAAPSAPPAESAADASAKPGVAIQPADEVRHSDSNGPPADQPIVVARADPTEEAGPPDRETIRSIQSELGRIGCDPGRPDGIWGRNSRAALASFAEHAGIDLAALEPTHDLLEKLKQRDARVCPLSCSVREEIRDGACVLKTCPAGQRLSSRGTCYTPAKTVTRSKQSSGRSSSSGGRNCFRFNGQLLCD